MLKISKNPFSALPVFDNDESDEENVDHAKVKKDQDKVHAASKKKNKIKKKNDEHLRNMFFGTGHMKTVNVKQDNAEKKQKKHIASKKEITPDVNNWEHWMEKDEQLTSVQYESDLKLAYLNSLQDEERVKVEKKKHAQLVKDLQQQGIILKDGKMKKKKEKTMSLQQFNEMTVKKPIASDDEDRSVNVEPSVCSRIQEHDTLFFSQAEIGAENMIHKEHIQQQYEQIYRHESLHVSKYKDELESKDKHIYKLMAERDMLKVSWQQEVQRNKKMEKLIKEGGLKEKSELLSLIDQLTGVKDELTVQVEQMGVDLEKERSKVHSLKSENDRLTDRLKGKAAK